MLAPSEESYPVSGPHADFAKKEQTEKLSILLTEEGLRAVMKE